MERPHTSATYGCNTIVLSGDSVSRCHARLERRDDGWWDEQVHEARLAAGERPNIGSTIGSASLTP